MNVKNIAEQMMWRKAAKVQKREDQDRRTLEKKLSNANVQDLLMAFPDLTAK